MADPRDFTVVFPIILRLSKVHVFRTGLGGFTLRPLP